MPSSVIRRIDYDEPARTMRITFVSGDLYAYYDVPPEDVEAFRAAASKGRHFAAHVRDRYDYELVRRSAGPDSRGMDGARS